MRNDQIASARVLIIQSQIKQYRVPFFDHLHQTLALDNISLRVAYSDPSRNEEKKGDNQDLPASYGVKVKSFRFLREAIFYQPLLLEILAADMIVVEQASKHLLNYLLLLLSALGAKKVAFWGHGRNCQRPGQGLAEWLKNITLNRVDWWFAYTDRTARYLIGQGVPLTKITSVQNSVDADAFRKECSAFSRAELQKTRSQLGIDESAKVALFCAGITREKLPEFLIHSARQIRRELPNFELLVVGGGPEQGIIEAAARDSSFIHFVGPQFGREKALYFRIADAFLMPGPLGLAILDAFSAGLPVVTSTAPFHGPEIDYLEEGRNGLVTPLEIGAYTRAVVRLLSDAAMLRELKLGSLASGEKYTMENMVERFREGIVRCLSGPARVSNQIRSARIAPTTVGQASRNPQTARERDGKVREQQDDGDA